MGLRNGYKAFNAALRSLYGRELLTLSEGGRPFDFDDALFDEAAKTVYQNGGFDISCLTEPQAQALINETLRVIDTAVGSALPHEVPDTIRYALENNAFVFSGFKTFHALREVGLSMLTEKGDIKPFGEFLTDVKQINAQYNHNYLYAEYNHALGAAQMAAKWHNFEQDGDRYNLQYRTAGDDKVREEHAILNGTTLPPSDPFWDMFLPPNGWNCRCTAVQVRKNKYPASDPELAMKRGKNCTEGTKKAIFRYNAGKSLQLFPPKHPYFKGANAEQLKQAINGYTPAEWTPKTIAEAELFFHDKLGVNCSLAGFTKANMAQVENIFRSVERHFQCYPELKKETLFVGSIRGRVQMLVAKKFEELKADPNFSSLGDEYLMKYAKEWIKKCRVTASKNIYAYSHGAFKEWGLSGICFNTSWKGENINKSLEKDITNKWHPPGTGSLKAVFDHELGHEIDRLLNLRSNAEFLKMYYAEIVKGKEYIMNNLSTYGYKNAAEFIAEAWSEYLNNEKPRPIAVSVGMLVKKLYAEKHQSSDKSPSSA